MVSGARVGTAMPANWGESKTLRTIPEGARLRDKGGTLAESGRATVLKPAIMLRLPCTTRIGFSCAGAVPTASCLMFPGQKHVFADPPALFLSWQLTLP